MNPLEFTELTEEERQEYLELPLSVADVIGD